MNTETYLRFLRACLTRYVPQEDLEDILHYYTEYFAEAGPEREAEVMASLGSPEELARKILEQREKEAQEEQMAAQVPIYQEPSGSGFPRWLGITLVALIGCCVVPAFGGLFLGFGVGGISLIVCGVLMVAFCAFGVGIGSMLLAWGAALVMISVGSLLIQAAKGMFYLLKKAMKGLWTALVEGEVSFREAVN